MAVIFLILFRRIFSNFPSNDGNITRTRRNAGEPMATYYYYDVIMYTTSHLAGVSPTYLNTGCKLLSFFICCFKMDSHVASAFAIFFDRCRPIFEQKCILVGCVSEGSELNM